MTNIFIDGSAGTTGLRIRERLSCRRVHPKKELTARQPVLFFGKAGKTQPGMESFSQNRRIKRKTLPRTAV